MMLRGYQQDIVNKCDNAWNNGFRNLMPVCATGSGKTVMMKDKASRLDVPAVATAHRSVLIGQMSMAFADAGIPHDIIASKEVTKTIVNAHLDEYGKSFYTPGNHFKVGSVQTFAGRMNELSAWVKRVQFGFNDEGHHVLADNSWGRFIGQFTHPEVRWMFPTATPERADGQGLGRHAKGLADLLIEGPPMRWLINNGYLTDYIVRAPLPSDLDMHDIEVGDNGEYNMRKVRKAVHRSNKIIGDIVKTYLKFTAGMLGIVFAVDIEHARKITSEFNANGVKAELITADDDEDTRRKIMKRYKARETLVLVNVDLFGEGFDLPAIEVVMFGRPTASYSLYAQQWGRALRLMISKILMAAWENYTPEQRLAHIAGSAKPIAHIHDHVGNLLHFRGPPDMPREFSLDGRSRARGPSDAIPLRTCANDMCQQPYERVKVECPYCGTEAPPPAVRGLPEHVDGDITQYTPEMLQRMFGVSTVEEAMQIRTSSFCAIPPNAPRVVINSVRAAHENKIMQQAMLDELISVNMPPIRNERENMRAFYLKYGIDVVQARRLNGKDTEELREKIVNKMKRSA